MKLLLVLTLCLLSPLAFAAQVDTKFIKDSAVTGPKIASGAVDENKINSSALATSLAGGSGTKISVRLGTHASDDSTTFLSVFGYGGTTGGLGLAVTNGLFTYSGGVLNIGADSIDGARIRLLNNTSLRARNFADSADVNILSVNASDQIMFAAIPYTPSSAPSANYQVANKKYVDDAIAGVSTPTWHRELITLAGGDITAQYVDMSVNCILASVHTAITGVEGTVGASYDYTLSTVASKTRITFGTMWATGGVSELLAGDIIQAQCQY
jgi:hypothetical protein